MTIMFCRVEECTMGFIREHRFDLRGVLSCGYAQLQFERVPFLHVGSDFLLKWVCF